MQVKVLKKVLTQGTYPRSAVLAPGKLPGEEKHVKNNLLNKY